MSRPYTVTKTDEVKYLFFALNELLFEPVYLYFLGLVFKDLELLMVVEEVVDLPTVYLIHANGHSEVAFMLLEVGYAPIKEVMNGQLLQTLHCVSLARASLTVSKHCHDALVEDEIQYRLDRILVQVFVWFVMGESIVKQEFRVVNEFSNTVHLVFAFMHSDHRVRSRHTVDLAYYNKFVYSNLN